MGTITVSGQLNTFLISLIFGAAYCFLYDAVRSLHKSAVKGKLGIFFLDVFYWILITLFTCTFALLFGKGEIRGYWLFGMAAGFIIFRFTLSRFAVWLFDFILIILRFVKKHLAAFFDFIFERLNIFIGKIPIFLKKIFKKKKKHLERAQSDSV